MQRTVPIQKLSTAGSFGDPAGTENFGWQSYLGSNFGTGEVSPHAAPSRLKSVEGLPPAYIAEGALDLLIDEDILYAQRLLKGGISTELHVYPGVTHMFDKVNPKAAVTEQFNHDLKKAIKNAFFK